MRSLQPELGVKICHKKYPNPEMLASNLHTKHVMVKCNTNVQLKIQPFLFKIKSSLGFQSDIIFFIYCFQSSEMERKQIWNKHIQLVTTQCLSVCLLTLKSLRSQIRGIGYISQFPPNCHLAYSRLTLKLRNLNHPKCYSFRGCGGGKKKKRSEEHELLQMNM